MRQLLLFTSGAAGLLSSLLYHDIGRHLIADGEYARVIVPHPLVQVVTVGLVFLLSHVVQRRGPRWLPPLLVAWCLWFAGGRVVAIDVMTGEITGHWFVLHTDDHTLRPGGVDPHRYLCDTNVRPRGWWIDLDYIGATDPVYLGPFLADRATAELRDHTAPCNETRLGPPRP